jgi:hypothetical protein
MSVGVVAVTLLGVACSSSSSSETSTTGVNTGVVTTPPAVSSSESGSSGIVGRWNGTWTTTSGPAGSGDFHIDFTQSGNNLTGAIVIAGTPCITTGTITGTLSGNTIAFGAVQGSQTISYSGTVSGNSMSGDYHAPDCGDAKGTWKATHA